MDEGTVVSVKPDSLTADNVEEHGSLWMADGTESALSNRRTPAYVFKSIATGFLHIWYLHELEGYDEDGEPDTEVDDGDG